MYDGCSMRWLWRRSELEVKRYKKFRKRLIKTSVGDFSRQTCSNTRNTRSTNSPASFGEETRLPDL